MKALISKIKSGLAKHERLLVALALTFPLFQLAKWALQEILAQPFVRSVATHTPIGFVLALAALVSLWPVSLRMIMAANGRARDASGIAKRIAAHMAFVGSLALGIWLAFTTFVVSWQPINGLLGIQVELSSAGLGLGLLWIFAIAAVVFPLANLIAGWLVRVVDRAGEDRGFVLWWLVLAVLALPGFSKFFAMGAFA